mgnify:CR=1 FL=1
MNDSYLSYNNELTKREKYQRSSSYIVNSEDNESDVSLNYTLLPEEYSVFSELNEDLFVLSDTEQHQFLSQCLQYLKYQLLNIYAQYGIIRVLPKLSASTDEDKAIILNWAYTNFRVYFNFEVIVDNSYYGIVAQNAENSIFTNSGKLNKKNYTSINGKFLEERNTQWMSILFQQIFGEEYPIKNLYQMVSYYQVHFNLMILCEKMDIKNFL